MYIEQALLLPNGQRTVDRHVDICLLRPHFLYFVPPVSNLSHCLYGAKAGGLRGLITRCPTSCYVTILSITHHP